MSPRTAVLRLVTSPHEVLVRRWNWKSALSSSLIRGTIFLCANLTSGWRAAAGAMFAEWAYRALTSGFYGAITELLGEVEPEWQGSMLAAFFLVLLPHSLELAVHWLRHTPHLKASIISSVIFTIFSTLFNLYSMRRGLLIVGAHRRPFLDDLRAMPRAIAGFCAVIPIWLWRNARSREA